ncbi:MAG: hypothetical protein ABIZ04_14945 [Opitutus sp.]
MEDDLVTVIESATLQREEKFGLARRKPQRIFLGMIGGAALCE